jgi:hypothetical protein
MFLLFQEEMLLPRVLPAAAHLDALLIHIPNVLGWDPTGEASMKVFHLIKVIIDNGFIEVLGAFRI